MFRSLALSSASSASVSRSQSLAHNGGPVNGKNKLMKLLDKNLKVVEARILLSELDEGDAPVVGLKNLAKGVGEFGGALLGVATAGIGMAINATNSDSTEHVDVGAGVDNVFDYIQRQTSGVVNFLSHFLVEIELEDDLVFTFERTSDQGVVFMEGASKGASKRVTMVLAGCGQTFADVNAFLVAEGELRCNIDNNNCKHLAYKFATKVMDCDTFQNYEPSLLARRWHFSGTVEEAGSNVKDLTAGDKVYGHLQYDPSTKQGSCAEYLVVPANDCAKVPDGVALDVAAAASTEAMTALQAMRDEGGLAKEKSVLVIAAGGGVGTQAIQIAKAGLGASLVDGVCSTRDVEKVKKLGADAPRLM